MPLLDTWLFPLTAVLLGGVGMVVLVRGLFGRWFRAGGKAGRVRSCRKCRFDLTATEGHTCPECGHTARHEAEHYASRFRWAVAALGLLLLIGAVGLAMTPGVKRDGWLHLLPMGLQVRLFHLEGQGAAMWVFSERLAGRTPQNLTLAGSGFAVRTSSHGAVVTPEVEAWREAAIATAVHVMTRERLRPKQQLIRAGDLLHRFHDSIDAQDLDRMLKIHGLNEPWIDQILWAWKGEPTQQIRIARRELMSRGGDRSEVMARMIAGSSLDPADERILAAFLADNDRVSAGRLSARSRAGILWADIPLGVWRAYAEEVRSGRIGNLPTLLDGAANSDRVTAAAIEYVASIDDAEERGRLVNALWSAQLKSAGPNSGLDRAGVRGLLAKSSDFKERQGLVRLLHKYDTENASWYIEIARDPDHPLRDQAMHEIGRVRHDRGRAFAFWSDEAWSDESLGLHHRMAALFSMRSWDRSDHAELAPFWEQVLQRAADADPLALEQGLARFTGPGVPPTTDAIIAVARRLAANGTSEDWLVDLAGRMASRWGRVPSLAGFADLLEDGRTWTLADAAWYRNEIESLIATVKALVPDEPDSPAREP